MFIVVSSYLLLKIKCSLRTGETTSAPSCRYKTTARMANTR